jgi:hypothetical protein
MAFLDLDKAFDRVNHNQLWQILNITGMPYNLIEVQLKTHTKIPAYKLAQEGKFLTKYISVKEYV